MTKIVTLTEIRDILAKIEPSVLIKSIEDGLIAYSAKQTIIGPVGYLNFKNPPGDMHIKYGYIQDDEVYVVKIASGFYDNPQHGLPSSNGTMLVFSQRTGELQTILLDEGYLTDVRTGVAGAIVAQYLAPAEISAIGIIGTGTQARLQLQYLKSVLKCRKVYVYGRSKVALTRYVEDMRPFGFDITTTQGIATITDNCNYIVSTTPSIQPLIMVDQVKSGTHITAIGADAPGKQELDARILEKADIVVVDSLSQCADEGEVSHALRQQIIGTEKLVELGDYIKAKRHRENDEQITVADLTGVAVQDIQIAKLIRASR